MALDSTLVAERTGQPIAAAFGTLVALRQLFSLDALLGEARLLPVGDSFERLALDRALASIDEAVRRIAGDALTRHGAGASGVAAWAGERTAELTKVEALARGFVGAPLTQARLTVLGGLLGDLARDG